MSHRDFIGFLEAINTDPDLARRVEEIQAETMDEEVERFIEVGRRAGFAFTEEEMDGLVLAHVASESGDELSSEALDAVAGGVAATGASPGDAMANLTSGFSLQYLALQKHMQQENRQFTILSNIMKVKHDTAKAAINNIRA